MRKSNLLPQPVHQRIWKKFSFGLPVRDGDPPGVHADQEWGRLGKPQSVILGGIVSAWICRTCAVEQPDTDEPPVCAICSDERQYVRPTGQQWTHVWRN